jgi:4-amino-4-deoxy-L-arabinose transferase-like glycosyltransferase
MDKTLLKRATKFLVSRNKDLYLLMLLIASVTFLNVIWSLLETRPPHWDMGTHLWKSLVYNWYLTTGDIWKFFAAYAYYLPLIYWISVPFYAVFGHSASVAVASINIVFLPILVFSMYGIGAYLWSRRVGLLSALAIVCTPYIASMGKEYMPDVPLTAVAALSLYLLLRTEGFGQRWYSVGFGVAFGFGMLTKWAYLFVFLVPLLLTVGRAVLTLYSERNWTPLKSAMLAGSVAFAICGYWYLLHFSAFKADSEIQGAGSATTEGEPAVGTAASNLYYLSSLLNEQLYLVPFLLLVVGLAIMIFRRDALTRNAELLTYSIGVYILFSLLLNKNPRYTLPMLVGVIPLCLYWFDLIPSKRIRVLMSTAVTFYSLAIFLLISFGSSFLPREVSFEAGGVPVTVYSEHGHVSGRPSGAHWHMEAMVRAVADDPAGPKTLSYSGPDTIWFNSESLRYYSTLYGIVFSYEVERYTGQYGYANPDKDSRYVAVRSYDQDKQDADLVLLEQYSLPDGSYLTLYRRDNGT